MRNPPAFQCYASDVLASEEFRLATLEERGLIWTMIMQCWVSGSVPKNPPELVKVLGLETIEITRVLTKRVLCFFDEQNDRLVRPELVEQKANMKRRREQQSEGGKVGAIQRWGKKNRRIGNPMGKPSTNPLGSTEKKRADKKGGELNRDSSSRYCVNSKSEEEEVEEYQRAFGEIR